MDSPCKLSEKPLHIVHTESSLGWGGQELRILSEAKGMIDRGHKITIICCPGSKIEYAAKEQGLKVHTIPIYKKRPRALRVLYQWLNKQRDVDVINCHSSTDSWLAALAILLSKNKVPLIRTRHVSTPVHTTRLNNWLYAKACQRVITTGETIKNQLIDQNAVPASQLVSVPTGVDLDHMLIEPEKQSKQEIRAQLGISASTLIIGCLAMMRDWKGHRYLIDATNLLQDLDIHLILVGEGEEKSRLLQQTYALGLSNKISFVGYQKDIRPYLTLMDMHCLPSYENEGISQALLQTCAASIPNIACDIGGNGEVIQHNETGLIVPTKSPESIAYAIRLLTENRKHAKSLGVKASKLVRENYASQGMWNAMEKQFYEVCKLFRH